VSKDEQGGEEKKSFNGPRSGLSPLAPGAHQQPTFLFTRQSLPKWRFALSIDISMDVLGEPAAIFHARWRAVLLNALLLLEPLDWSTYSE
jgi:hypothetical protein